jgi:putative aldouronate transport system substrate-binding protein
MTAPDKKIYTIPMMIAEDEGSSNDLYNTMAISIRKDWARKLGFDKDPETLDELYELLKAYRDGDPNNTGKNDVVAWGGVGWSVGNPIGWAYGLRLQMDGGWALRDGKVEFDYMNPRAKEWLQTLNKWYNEGLIDRDFASLSWDSFSSRMLNSEIGTVVATALSPPIAWNGNIIELTGDPEAGLYPILPVKGPYGHKEAEARMAAVSPNQYLVLSKDIKNPELAIKWLDLAKFSEKGLRWTQFGVEGLTYDLVDGTPKIQNWVFESKDGSSLELFRVGALSYNLPQVLQVYARRESFIDYEYLFPLLEEIYNYRVIRFPTMLSSSSEAERLAAIMAEVNTYLEESITRFINGAQSIDKFDEFINTLKQLGIEEAISIKQAQYDRTQ